MTVTPPHDDWITPAELGKQMGMSERWVKDQMSSGALPSVKVGGRRWWTPGCMAELEARNLAARTEHTWGRKTRRGAA